MQLYDIIKNEKPRNQ